MTDLRSVRALVTRAGAGVVTGVGGGEEKGGYFGPELKEFSRKTFLE